METEVGEGQRGCRGLSLEPEKDGGSSPHAALAYARGPPSLGLAVTWQKL